jgi:hypothetical protein
MSTDRHVTIIEVDTSQAVTAEAKLEQATRARIEASRRLAEELDDAEKARIATLLRSEDAAKRMAGARRDEVRLAKQAIAQAREEENAIKQSIAAERQREAAITRSQAAAERLSQATTRSSGGMLNMGASIGSVVTGFNAFLAVGQQVIAVVDKLAGDSMMAQNVAANLQIPIDGARESFKGLVEDVELARIANMAFELGVVETGAEFEALAAGVQAKAEKLGVSATELFDNAVTGIGRGSALILDNLGIILDQAKAEKIYAQSLAGKDGVVPALNAYQKSVAFAKAATLEIAKAGKDATAATDSLAHSYERATVMVSNFRSGMLGFEDTAGRTREALRKLSDEELKNITQTETYGAAVVQSDRALAKYGVTLEDVKGIGNPVALAQAEQERRAAKGLEFERKQIEENNNTRANGLKGWAADTRDQIEMQQVLGASQSHLIELELEALNLEREASIILGNKTDEDRARTHEIEKQIELERARLGMAQAEESKPKSGGRKRDPNETLDMETTATLRLLDARQQIYAAELDGERDLEGVAKTREYLLSLEREELAVREQAANQRKVKGAKETAERDAELLDILTERRLLDIDAQGLQREEGRRLAEERLSAMDREIERQAALGVAVGLLEQRRADAHVAMVAEFGETEELRQAEHERDVQQIEDERAYVESQGQAKLQAFNMEMEIAQARGQQIYDIASKRLELEARIAAAEGDHARQRALLHKAEVARIEERRAKLARATQTTNSMLGQGAALFSAIADQTIKDEAKREKAALRARGVEAVARGALETVEAVASFASLNIVQGVLHTAAAATAFATGIPMIAGKVPDKGAGSASGGGAGHQTVVNAETSGGSGSSMSGSPMTPPSAEEMINLRQQQGGTLQTTASKQQGGTVIQIGTLITGDSGTILHDYNQQQLKKRGTA